MTLALFDFDGTITTHDSLIQFIRFAVGDGAFIRGMIALSPMLTAYKLKLIPNDKAKERMLGHFFTGVDREEFMHLADTYSADHIPSIVRPAALKKIRWHQERADKVVIVSASMECWLKTWCKTQNIELIGTRLAYEDAILTGKFLTPNCYGNEKARRVREHYNLDDFESIYAYGDSRGDRELLALADHAFYKPFRGDETL